MADIRIGDFVSDKSFAAHPAGHPSPLTPSPGWLETRVRHVTFHIQKYIYCDFKIQWFLPTNNSVPIEALELCQKHFYLVKQFCHNKKHSCPFFIIVFINVNFLKSISFLLNIVLIFKTHRNCWNPSGKWWGCPWHKTNVTITWSHAMDLKRKILRPNCHVLSIQWCQTKRCVYELVFYLLLNNDLRNII